jgi:mono/diheme cytochrome c family protein
MIWGLPLNIIKLFVLAAATAAFAVGCSTTAPTANQTANSSAPKTPAAANTSPGNVVAVQPQQSASGKELFAENCQICHKENGTGGKVTIKGKNLNAENLTEDKFKKASDEKLMGYIQNGVPDEGMPAFGDKLSDDQVVSIVAHIRTLQQ